MRSSASSPADSRAEPAYRMRDLVRASGVPRETIHFYLANGMLPRARKTGRNTALYGEDHLERLRRIVELRDRHFLPLRAIRAVLGEGEGGVDVFTPSQRTLIEDVRAELVARARRAKAPAALRSVQRRTKLSGAEIDEFRSLGIVEVDERDGTARVAAEDARILELWSRAKVIGRFGARGVTPRHAGVLAHAVEELVRDEIRLFTDLYAGTSGIDAAAILEGVVPLVNEILALLHEKALRRFFRERSLPDRRRTRARRAAR